MDNILKCRQKGQSYSYAFLIMENLMNKMFKMTDLEKELNTLVALPDCRMYLKDIFEQNKIEKFRLGKKKLTNNKDEYSEVINKWIVRFESGLELTIDKSVYKLYSTGLYPVEYFWSY